MRDRKRIAEIATKGTLARKQTAATVCHNIFSILADAADQRFGGNSEKPMNLERVRYNAQSVTLSL